MTSAITNFNLAETGIQRGRKAWDRIRSTSAGQRALWLEVGVALLYGKQKGNRRDGQKFSEWVQEVFPGLRQNDAASAIWWATNSTTVGEIPAGLTHPERIQRWFNEQQADQEVPEDLQAVAPEPTIQLPQRDAERVAKTILRAASGDEGAETAKRHVEALAKKHGTTVEQLTRAARQGAPDTFHRFTPTLQAAIDDMRASLWDSVTEMRADGIPADVIKDIFVHFTNTLDQLS